MLIFVNSVKLLKEISFFCPVIILHSVKLVFLGNRKVRKDVPYVHKLCHKTLKFIKFELFNN